MCPFLTWVIMQQRDYVLELIRRAVQFITEAMGLAKNDEVQQAKNQLNRAAIQLVGIDLDSAEELSIASVRMMFVGVQGFDVARCMVLGNLLKERADLEENGNLQQEMYKKARLLLIDAGNASADPLPINMLQALADISDLQELPSKIQQWIMDMEADFGHEAEEG